MTEFDRRGSQARPKERGWTLLAFVLISIAVLGGVMIERAETVAETPGGAATPGLVPEGEGGISAEAYFAGLEKAGAAEAGRKKYAEQYEGRKVSWTGYVRALSRNKSPDGDSFALILKTTLATEPPLHGFVAWFELSDESALKALAENHKVAVSGTLSVQRDPNIPVLNGAKIAE